MTSCSKDDVDPAASGSANVHPQSRDGMTATSLPPKAL
eukprot:CAMPEP_0178595822 /NCGR_PEP_ID=MMETSP0697-20121206/31286_1 /TAXON_ID=265572 /ORGANISM="Extubocellulus spinifer, Strain CCMP396" /LENGTH=37 /DNA_ID= /DNA_START= /DNA_END= /DNA_ORIENTATION=